MSDLKKRIKVLEGKVKPEDRDFAELEYVVKYLEAPEEKRKRMREPIITLELIKRVISPGDLYCIDFGRDDDDNDIEEKEGCCAPQKAN